MRKLNAASMLIVFTTTVLIVSIFISSCSSQKSEQMDDEKEKVSQKQEKAIQEKEKVSQEIKKKGEPFDIWSRFSASGWMGDGAKKEATKYIQLLEACRENPHSAPLCIKITYTPGPDGWAGIYWLNKPDNWGQKPGENFQRIGYKKLTFWARGENGGEVVEFKAGGIDARKRGDEYIYIDSFEVSPGKFVLDNDWKQYTLDLEGKDLSSVIGGFCWVANRAANSKGLTFYIDDIYYDF
jgi:hypothetical protein